MPYSKLNKNPVMFNSVLFCVAYGYTALNIPTILLFF